MRRFSATIEADLKRSGWEENRSTDVNQFLLVSAKRGVRVPDAAREFVEEFGELTLELRCGSLSEFSWCKLQVASSLGLSLYRLPSPLIPLFAAVVGCDIAPVAADRGNHGALWLVDARGRSYYFDRFDGLTLSWFADSVEGGLEALGSDRFSESCKPVAASDDFQLFSVTRALWSESERHTVFTEDQMEILGSQDVLDNRKGEPQVTFSPELEHLKNWINDVTY